MIKYLLSSFILVLGINIIKLILIFSASLYYKKDFKKSIYIKPKILFVETSILIFLLTLSFWFIDYYLNSEYSVLLFSLFFVSLIPSYNFILSPLKYIFSKKEYLRNNELEKIIQGKGYEYNLIVIKGNIINAYATGILPFSKTILIGQTLKENMSKQNLLAIIFHEIGHLKLNHLAKLYFINTLLSLLSLIAFFVRIFFLQEVKSTIYEPLSIFILGLFIGLCFWYIPGKIQYKLELEADFFASKVIGVKEFEKALIELDSLSDGLVSKGGITHPKLLKRIKNIYKK
jgi:Zn-dependent protease with chaperone function